MEFDDGYLEDVIEEIKLGVKVGNILVGFFVGVDYVVDVDKVSEEFYFDVKVNCGFGIGFSGFGVGVVVGGIVVVVGVMWCWKV